jgi:hypothetical protein
MDIAMKIINSKDYDDKELKIMKALKEFIFL